MCSLHERVKYFAVFHKSPGLILIFWHNLPEHPKGASRVSIWQRINVKKRICRSTSIWRNLVTRCGIGSNETLNQKVKDTLNELPTYPYKKRLRSYMAVWGRKSYLQNFVKWVIRSTWDLWPKLSEHPNLPRPQEILCVGLQQSINALTYS